MYGHGSRVQNSLHERHYCNDSAWLAQPPTVVGSSRQRACPSDHRFLSSVWPCHRQPGMRRRTLSQDPGGRPGPRVQPAAGFIRAVRGSARGGADGSRRRRRAVTLPAFQIPIAGQHDRHYDRNGALEWVWCEDKFVLFKGGCAVAWLVADDPLGQWLTMPPAPTASGSPGSTPPGPASRPGRCGRG